MAYVGADPELVEAAEEAQSGPPADGDKPAKARTEKPAKAAKPVDTPKDTEEPKGEPSAPETTEKPATSEPAKEDTKPDTEEDKEDDKEDDAKKAKGLAAVARAERQHLERKQAFEQQAARLAQQLETRDRDIATREGALKERETRISDVEKAIQYAKQGDFDAIFSYLEAQGITAEAANGWLAKAPQTPEARAQNSQLTAIQQELAALKKERQEEREAARRQAEEREQRQAEERFLRAGANEEKYPFLNAIYSPEQIFAIAGAEFRTSLEAQGVRISDLDSYPLEEVMAAYERVLEQVDQKARSNQKLKSLLGVAEAPQHNGNGTHASKPAPARTLSHAMTAEKARTSFVSDDEADREALRLLDEMKRAQKAAQT